MRRLKQRLCRLWKSESGFAAAESVLLALLLCGICIAVGTILQGAAIQAARDLNNELAGSASH